MKYTITSPGEHHMGSPSVEIILDKAIKGVKKFFGTNLVVIDDPAGRVLVIYDAAVILVLDSKDASVYHALRTKGDCIIEPRIELGKFLYQTRENGKEKSLDLAAKKDFSKGFGPVSAGRFPSAY